MKFPRHPSLLLLSCLLSFPLPGLSQDSASAEAFLDWETGEVCFPLEIAGPRYYDACLRLDSLEPLRLSLASAVRRTFPVPGAPVYDPANGLTLPVVRTSDGRAFTGVRLSVSLDVAASRYILRVLEATNVTPNRQWSAARMWNEELLESIRNDLARPTVHARNLFHAAVAMYDAWAAFDTTSDTYLLGKTVNGYTCPFEGPPAVADTEAARAEAISHAAFRLLSHRFANTPGGPASLQRYRNLMIGLGLDPAEDSLDYTADGPAALGNHIAECVIGYGLRDGANELNNYASSNYLAVNEAFIPGEPGNGGMRDPNRWQPLSFEVFRDQSGNVFQGNTPAFVGAEWGRVKPFALSADDLTVRSRDGRDWWVYHDPGQPPQLQAGIPLASSEQFKRAFVMVVLWSAHLDPDDGVMWDISPGSIGNIPDYPARVRDYPAFYKERHGGDPSQGWEINPHTGEPYAPQLVPRGDYTRVLAEFWADGPHSETPPGHWHVILNNVSDDPLLEKRIGGEGPVVSDLEWDVKAYLALGGAMHDSAVTAWGIKGYYDYVRPVSAIRYMASKGQSSDPDLPSYHSDGLPLIPGHIELVGEGDPLAGDMGENVGKIKVYAWRGPYAVTDGETQKAGVGWILGENWFPYQRLDFVTPPFAGYISGHSTFSRAAAEVMTLLTGDEYFPGGLGEYAAPKDEFLIFENGPSVDVVLQWATYRDASDQTSLSRIWGGIHPGVDDLPGRLIGMEIGVDAFARAMAHFEGTVD